MSDRQQNEGPDQYILSQPRPWPFSRSELTAGLRRFTGDSLLQIDRIEPADIPQQRPSIGRIRGLSATCKGKGGSEETFHLVLKEPQGTTRTGTAGVGLREVSVYRVMSEQIPVPVPQLLAAHALGDWLVLKLLPPGKEPSQWTAAEYLLAIQNLVALHDKFWNLDADLSIYTWLARPLDSDFDIYVRAAANGVGHMVDDPPPALFARDPQLANLFGRLVLHADKLVAPLHKTPGTLIHGDFWPGNLHIDLQGTLTALDWQQAGIGPGILDLVTFLQASRWWFDPLPIPEEDIIAAYRESLAAANGHRWDAAEWEILWDHGLMWTFVAHWIDLVAAIPESLVETRLVSFEEIWLSPLRKAAERRRIPEAIE